MPRVFIRLSAVWRDRDAAMAGRAPSDSRLSPRHPDTGPGRLPGRDLRCRLAAVNRRATPPRWKIHSIGHSGQTWVRPVGGRSTMIRIVRRASALVQRTSVRTPADTARRHGSAFGAPRSHYVEDHGTFWEGV